MTLTVDIRLFETGRSPVVMYEKAILEFVVVPDNMLELPLHLRTI